MQKKRTRTDPRTVIRCGTEDNAKLAYLAMFRYCFGRMTYMPGVCIEIIKRNAEHLTDRTLDVLDIELTDEAKRYERLYKGKSSSNYGMDCDRRAWLAFHAWVKAEIAERQKQKEEAGDDA